MGSIFHSKVVYLLLFVLVLGCGMVCSQNHDLLLELKLKGFKALVKQSPELVDTELCWLFITKAETSFNNKDYKTALTQAEKARVLAIQIKSDFILYVSHRQLGKIAFYIGKHRKAHSHFHWATKYFAREIQNNPSVTIKLQPEHAYLYYYWGSNFLNSSNNHAYLDRSILRFADAYRISATQTERKYDDVFTRTSLNIARWFGLRDYHLTKLLWIETAKLRSSESIKNKNELFFQIHYESSNAASEIGDYSLAAKELYKIENIKTPLSLDSQLRYLFASAIFNGSVNKVKQKHVFLNKGADLAKKTKSKLYTVHFYVELMLQHILDRNWDKTKLYLTLIEEIEEQEPSLVKDVDIYVAKAILYSYAGDIKLSDLYFDKAEDWWINKGRSWRIGQFVFGWRAETMLFQKNYKKLRLVGEKYLNLALKANSKDSLPFIYIILARAHLGLGDIGKARNMNQKALNLIESKRKSNSAQISTGVFEHLFEAYKLETTFNLRENKIGLAFSSSEQMKGRWLNDKIAGNPLNQKIIVDSKIKNEIFDLTLEILKKPKDKELFARLSVLEKKALSIENPNNSSERFENVKKNIVTELEISSIGGQTSVISYAFTIENKLVAFVWQRGKGLKVKHLDISKEEVDKISQELPNKIKNLVFFKQDGKFLYDKLLKPLEIDAKHLIIIPDKSLWRIPFQALSKDGRTYLIENTEISYAPSVSILLNQLSNPKPKRQSFQVFSNSLYNNRFLKFTDIEAKNLAKLYKVKPSLNTSESSFREKSDKSDIIHFSMHAEVDKDEPFNSFLGFKPFGKDDGKLTVDELLKLKFRKGSLAFVASCDTTNVFNGEGLVSLAWGMMAAGSSTVISAQWEANDKSTARFTNSFYKHLRQGLSASEALQKASIELINDKSANMSAPSYWAEFFLLGDYR